MPKTKKNDDLCALILSRIAAGQSVRSATADLDVDASTFLRWTYDDAALAQQYARACEERAIVLAEDMVEIADNGAIPADHKRVMVDVRKWYSSKLAPKRFSERVQSEVSGSDGKPLFEGIKRVIVEAPAS